MEQIPVGGQLPSEDKLQNIRSPLINSPPDLRETFADPTECSRSNEENAEIMNIPVNKKING